MGDPLAKAVRDANRHVFENRNFDAYDKNPSIFEPSRQAEIRRVLEGASARGRGRLVDIGCGTGNLLRLGRDLFDSCCGVDLSGSLLAELNRRMPGLGLARGEADRLPFPAASADVVTAYGVLHHLVDPAGLFAEAHRILRPGGLFYADHDPNLHFGRFYHIYYRLRYLGRHGFGDAQTDLSEFHHTQTGGLHPERLAGDLRAAGFSRVEISYRITTNPSLPFAFRLVRAMMRAAARIVPLKSLHTHFSLQAFK